MNYYYYINESDSFIFKPIRNKYSLGFVLYSKGEAGTEMKVGTYAHNRWIFDDDIQRNKFFTLIQMFPLESKRAFKAYWKSLDEKPTQLECGYRKFKVKYFKFKRELNNWFYKTFSTYNR